MAPRAERAASRAAGAAGANAAAVAAKPDQEPFEGRPPPPAEAAQHVAASPRVGHRAASLWRPACGGQRVIPDSTPLEAVLAGRDTLRELGGLTRNDRLERAWLSGLVLKSWYFGERTKATDLPAPPAKTTVWGYVAQGRPVRWTRKKAVYSREARSLAGPRVDFEFCSQTELRAFCLGISHDVAPIEIPASQPVAADGDQLTAADYPTSRGGLLPACGGRLP